MSIFVSFSMYFLSFVPLWITVLFIDIKSLIEGGGDKWTEIISISGILLGVLTSLIILFVKFFVADDEKYVLTIQEAKESKTITAEFLLSYILPLHPDRIQDDLQHSVNQNCNCLPKRKTERKQRNILRFR